MVLGIRAWESPILSPRRREPHPSRIRFHPHQSYDIYSARNNETWMRECSIVTGQEMLDGRKKYAEPPQHALSHRRAEMYGIDKSLINSNRRF